MVDFCWFPLDFRFSLVNKTNLRNQMYLTGIWLSRVSRPQRWFRVAVWGGGVWRWHLNPSSCQVLSRNCVGRSYVITYCTFWGGGNISWESCTTAVMAGPGALVFSKIKINEKSVFSEPKRVIQNPAPQHGRCDLSDPCTWAFFFFVTFRFDFFGGWNFWKLTLY